MLFNIGKVLVTPAALTHLTSQDASPHELISRHLNGDWGDLCSEDKKLNNLAFQTNERILSAYVVVG